MMMLLMQTESRAEPVQNDLARTRLLSWKRGRNSKASKLKFLACGLTVKQN